MVVAMMNSHSLTGRVLAGPLMRSAGDFGNPAFRGVEMPGTGGIGQSRAIARAYSALAMGGSELGILPRTMHALMARSVPPTRGERDLVLGCT